MGDCSFPKNFIPNLTPSDLVDRLPMVNPGLASEARKILDINKSERHIRGGLATREKYLREHKRNSEQEKEATACPTWYRKVI